MTEFQQETKELKKRLKKISELIDTLNTTSDLGYISPVNIDEFLFETEKLCITSRILGERYRISNGEESLSALSEIVSNVTGTVEVTEEGWLDIKLNTLLPSTKRYITSYIRDTISRLLDEYPGTLPFFDTAFMAIVEYCDFDNHRALDNDNKYWKMIPNGLKGRVIKDDTQFHLSIGLFTKISQDIHCEVIVMAQKDIEKFCRFLGFGTDLYVE